jgi:hypothetical protein
MALTGQDFSSARHSLTNRGSFRPFAVLDNPLQARADNELTDSEKALVTSLVQNALGRDTSTAERDAAAAAITNNKAFVETLRKSGGAITQESVNNAMVASRVATLQDGLLRIVNITSAEGARLAGLTTDGLLGTDRFSRGAFGSDRNSANYRDQLTQNESKTGYADPSFLKSVGIDLSTAQALAAMGFGSQGQIKQAVDDARRLGLPVTIGILGDIAALRAAAGPNGDKVMNAIDEYAKKMARLEARLQDAKRRGDTTEVQKIEEEKRKAEEEMRRQRDALLEKQEDKIKFNKVANLTASNRTEAFKIGGSESEADRIIKIIDIYNRNKNDPDARRAYEDMKRSIANDPEKLRAVQRIEQNLEQGAAKGAEARRETGTVQQQTAAVEARTEAKKATKSAMAATLNG